MKHVDIQNSCIATYLIELLVVKVTSIGGVGEVVAIILLVQQVIIKLPSSQGLKQVKALCPFASQQSSWPVMAAVWVSLSLHNRQERGKARHCSM